MRWVTTADQPLERKALGMPDADHEERFLMTLAAGLDTLSRSLLPISGSCSWFAVRRAAPRVEGRQDCILQEGGCRLGESLWGLDNLRAES